MRSMTGEGECGWTALIRRVPRHLLPRAGEGRATTRRSSKNPQPYAQRRARLRAGASG